MKKKILYTVMIMILGIILTSCGTDKIDKIFPNETTDTDKTVILDGFSVEFENQVLIDNEFATISIKDTVKTDSLFKLYLQIENKLNSDLSVATSLGLEEWCSVNGYMVENGFLIDESENIGDDVIPAKGRGTRVVIFSIPELEMYGLTGIADIELRFLGIDNSDLLHNFKSDIIKITTDNADGYDYDRDTYLEKLRECEELKYLEENIFEEQGLKVVSHAVVEKYEDEPEIYIEFANTTEDTIKARLFTITLNGIELDKDLDETLIINPGTRRVISFSIDQLADWEDENIRAVTDVEEFEYEFTFEKYEDGEEVTSGNAKIEIK